MTSNAESACLKEQGFPYECGSPFTYGNHGCHGAACRAGNVTFNRSQRERRHERMIAGEVFPTHGKESTYFNYKCRCDPCGDEHNRREAERRSIRVAAKTASETVVEIV